MYNSAFDNTKILKCTVTVTKNDIFGAEVKKRCYKEVYLLLGRNEHRDLTLKLEGDRVNQVFQPTRNVAIHSKFVKDGKATIRIPEERIYIMLSNCPPLQLCQFLKLLKNKTVTSSNVPTIVKDRRALYSDKSKDFQEISPIAYNKTSIANKTFDKSGIDCATPIKNYVKSSTREKLIKKRQFCSIPSLTAEQKYVIDAVLAGKNVFFTGSAGTGKSYLLKHIIKHLPPDNSVVTASTGVAASQIGGTTLHNFAGIGNGLANIDKCIELASIPSRLKAWRKCRYLIVDEISMIDGDYFDKIEYVARQQRKSTLPFGGIQLILCGDFLQLPPVSKNLNEDVKFCFQASSWQHCISTCVNLTKVYRQDNSRFIAILESIRFGRCTDEVMQMLNRTSSNRLDKYGIKATKLCTHNEDVYRLNNYELKSLPDEERHFISVDSGDLSTVDSRVISSIPRVLVLKLGAQVMLTKNIDLSKGLVNGARGIVISFERTLGGDLPVIKFSCGIQTTIKLEKWSFRTMTDGIFDRQQLPLKLAWAISIHKSQGMSLDCVEVSLGRVFEYGQAYVALSRARNLDGLRIVDFQPNSIKAHPMVLDYYGTLS